MPTTAAIRPENFRVVVASKGRAQKVLDYTLKLFPDASVVVPPEEVWEYQATGCKRIIPQDGVGISGARNTALDMFPDDYLLILDDDVKEIGRFLNKKKKRPWDTPALLRAGLAKLFKITEQRRGIVFSGAPTNNPYFYNLRRPISTNLFLIGTFCGYMPRCPIRYDETLRLKEDYDFTVKAWQACGIALRFNYVYCDALHYSNAGGAVATRNDDTEAEAIAILLKRYPQYIRMNQKRHNEVLLKLPRRR